MSYTVEATYTKPANKKWFAEVHPGLAQRFNKVDRARAVGLIDRQVNKVNDYTILVISTWNSEADYQAFIARKGASVADALRGDYSRNNGITVTTRIV